ncbi:hypothetical protein [Longimicrobium terrae]|uniref:Uncharacterized protein n=1 Tax=Longimicrobium terrae TaxID=1639882 RepID=A0A841GZ31_9BACT|nr:hypothetical protein [Longimicrobium terrae]MBB4636421.1 hypothetical protein [Longimicrobium terrae]MBB6071055.1 hypothetical protein [Longimicrobium terrae]NNC29076.1 hypothetical protein [Longimicrobium terrae]
MGTVIPLLVLLSVSPHVARGSGFTDAPQAPAVAEGGCPAPETDAEARIRRLLTTPLIADLRARYDFGTATADTVLLLTDECDRRTCDSLRTAIVESGANLTEKDRISFYRSGNRFLVPVSRHREVTGTVHFDGHSSVDIYDADFRLVGRFMA